MHPWAWDIFLILAILSGSVIYKLHPSLTWSVLTALSADRRGYIDVIVQCLYCAFRAKFAERKGKTLKMPSISEKSATFSRNPKPAPRPKTGPKATIGAQSEPVVQSEAVQPTAALKTDDQTNDVEVPDNKTVCSRRSSDIMNTTVDLQNNSDLSLPVDPEIRMESVRTRRVFIVKPIEILTDVYI